MDSRAQLLPKAEIIVALLVLACGITFSVLALVGGLSSRAVIIICAVAVTISICISPLFGLCFTVVATMLVELPAFSLIEEYGSVARVLAGVTAFSFVFRLVAEKHLVGGFREGFQSNTLRWYAFLGLWPLLLTPFAMATPFDQFIQFLTQLSLVGLAFLMGTIPRNLRQLEVLIVTICVGAAIVGLYTIAFGLPKVSATWVNHEHLEEGTHNYSMAYAMAIALIMSIIPIKSSGWIIRSVLIATDVVLCLSITFTLSRATWVGLAVCMFLAPILVPRVPLRYRVANVCAAFSLGLVAIYLLATGALGDHWHVFLDRATSSVDSQQSAQRLDYVWPMSIAFIKDHFLIGGGLGTQRGLDIWTHNIFLEVGVESGLIGLIFFALFLVATLTEAIRNADPILRLCSVCIICFWMVVGQFMHPLFIPSFAVSMGVLACMANLGLCTRRGMTSRSEGPIKAHGTGQEMRVGFAHVVQPQDG